jgi:phosphoribosylglycinamide formyltransferase-1
VIRIAVLASGGGTNFQAILDACAARRIDGRVAVLLSNVPDAFALERARKAGVATEVVPSKGVVDREGYDRSLVERLGPHQPDLVCLAGYMRILTPAFLSAFGPAPATRGCPRVMNIHPALLPAFPGLHVQKAALDHGARFSGCTVHFVDQGTDTGPIIVQAVVPVLPTDTEESLSARILAEEHRIYPQAIQWFAEGRLSLAGRRVTVSGASPAPVGAIHNPSPEG